MARSGSSPCFLVFAQVVLVCFAACLALTDARRLSSMQHLAVQSIKTKHGDIFDCVDINKQPALHHPLLRNHSLEVRVAKDSYTRLQVDSSSIGLPDGGCAEGTVPIRRNLGADGFVRKDSTGHHWAALKLTGNTPYYGTEVHLNTWSPKLVTNAQFSRSQLWLTSGPYNEINSIEAGWMVSSTVYGDVLPRLFVSWTADGYVKTGCVNLECPGFVQVSKTIALGHVMNPLSSYNGAQADVKLAVFRAPETGNWWLTYGESDEIVGYWPSSIFTHMQGGAFTLQWGGQALNANPNDPAAEMGSGHFAAEGYGKASYVKKIKTIDTQLVRADAPTTTSIFVDAIKCYTVVDGGNTGGDMGRNFFFGGPGGHC